MTVWSKDIHISSKEGEDNEACGSTLSPCFSLQQAIHQANWNDVIILPSNPSREWQADTCKRSHVIQRNLTILGWHKTKTAINCMDKERETVFLVIQSTDEGYVNVIIEHLELRNLTRSNGIKLEGASIMARNCFFSNISKAVFVYDSESDYSSSLMIQDCTFQRYMRAILFLSSQQVKIHVTNSVFQGIRKQAYGIRVIKPGYKISEGFDMKISDSIFAWNRANCFIEIHAKISNFEMHNVVVRNSLKAIILKTFRGPGMQLFKNDECDSVWDASFNEIEWKNCSHKYVNVFESTTCSSDGISPCPATTYTLQAGSEKRNENKVKTRNPTCKECPYGATCNQGIHANPNYFGIHYSAKLKFTICPKGYCCKKNCTGLQTCAEGRRGTLCGRCKQGYSENIIDTHCTKEEDCNKWWISLIVLLTAILYVCVFLYLQEIIRNICLLLSVWKSSKGDSSDVTKDSGCRVDGKNGSVSISSLIKVILYFYQLQFFINVTGVTKLDETKEKLREFISNALNFQPSHHIISGCPFKGLTPVTKKLYITQFNIFIYLVLCVLYVLTKVKARPAIGRENNAFTTRLYKAITTLMLINTASLANTSLALLNCVNLGPNNVLFIDGEITCFQPWQYIVMAYFLLFVLPVSIVLMCGARLLQKDRISATQFIVCMAFPFIFPCFITKCSGKRVCDTDHNMDEHTLGLTEKNECLMGNEDESNETESNIVSGHLGRRNATDNDTVADGNDDDLCDDLVSDSSTRNNFIAADKDLVTSSARNSVLEVLTKPFERPDGCGPIHWEGILLIRRLGVVCLSTMITNEVIRLYVLLLWLVVSLLHHLWVQPFRKRSYLCA
eukprot:gene6901-7679_t